PRGADRGRPPCRWCLSSARRRRRAGGAWTERNGSRWYWRANASSTESSRSRPRNGLRQRGAPAGVGERDNRAVNRLGGVRRAIDRENVRRGGPTTRFRRRSGTWTPPRSKLQSSRKEVQGQLIIWLKASRDTAQDPGPQELTISLHSH